MERRNVRCLMRNTPVSDGLLPMAILVMCFSVGAIVGFLIGLLSPESTALSEYLLGYLEAVSENGRFSVGLLSVVWDLLRWPLAAFLLGVTRLGIVGLPILLAIRGFLLSHAITVFCRLFGFDGLIAALIVFGVASLIIIPVLFAISFDGFQMALMRGRGKTAGPIFLRERVYVWLICLGCLMIASAMQWTLMPALMSFACAKLFTL